MWRVSCWWDYSSHENFDHDFCRPSLYREVSLASAFTLFVNNGGLRIPSNSVFTTIELCEHIFRQYVCQKGNSVNSTGRLKNKMILEVCHHLLLDGNKSVCGDHELGANEDMVEDDHQVKRSSSQQTNVIHCVCLRTERTTPSRSYGMECPVTGII